MYLYKNKEIMLPYIAGFFDADGSVSVMRSKRNETRKLSMGFTNTDKGIIDDVREFLLKEGLNGYIFSPKKEKEHHLQGYELRYMYQHAERLAQLLRPYIRHLKKKNRIDVYLNEYRPLIKRNGKYSQQERLSIEDIGQKILGII